MDINSEKSALIKRLEQVNDLSLIQAIQHMLDYGLKQSKNRITIEQYNKELDEAEAEIERGDFISQEEIRKQAEEW